MSGLEQFIKEANLDIKVEVKEGNKTTSYVLNTKPTEEAISKVVKDLEKDLKSWIRDTFKKETSETLV